MANPLIRDRLVDFLLNEVLHVSDLCDLPEFEDGVADIDEPREANVGEFDQVA